MRVGVSGTTATEDQIDAHFATANAIIAWLGLG
jgi:hypothetical protein